jgi:hypothetical protein
LKNVFEVVRRVERVQDLPKAEASVLEWGRISYVPLLRAMAWADVKSCCNYLPGLCGQ